MALPTSILNVLAEDIRDWLIAELQTAITGDPGGENAKAGLVQIGKLRDDPTEDVIGILVHLGDEEWPHELNLDDKGPGMFGPTYEMGGGYTSQGWRRRFVIDLRMFFEGEYDQDVARQKAAVVLSRAHNALARYQMPGVTDDFGESAHMLQVCKMYTREGGGDGNWIWKGEVFIEVFTHIEPT